MDKYEISIWEDFSDWYNGKEFLNERKIAIIGSDTMTAQARAIEPNLVNELNGTNTFTFKMYYTYIDNRTGEKYENPFGKYLINERKVKVYWKDKWYDMIIKKCQEDTSKKVVTYTCKDLFINELSKNGYSLEFNTDLQNNIGTISELAASVLEGSTWRYDYDNSDKILQKSESPVYEVTTQRQFNANKQPNDVSILIPNNKKILVFYDSVVDILDESKANDIYTQFLYASNGYETDINDALVINGDCYDCKLNYIRNGNYLDAYLNNNLVFRINVNSGVSENYRGERYIKKQLNEYDPLLDRYVLLCRDSNGKEVYEIATTEYSNPLAIINLVANPTEFTSTAGWIGQIDEFGIYPKFGTNTNLSNYNAKSYLKIKSGSTYNAGIQSNLSWFKPTDTEVQKGIIGGFQKNEKYVFRVKAKSDSSGPTSYLTNINSFANTNIYQYNSAYIKIGNPLFSQSSSGIKDNWLEYTLICNQSVPAAEIDKWGLFINSNGTYWIEDIQFFKYAEGVTSYDENAIVQRINPGDISLQSIVKPVYKYYYKENTAETADQLTYLYVGENESLFYTPVYNDYEKIGTINEKESNRFNILQSIAETFQAWVRFRIDHEENGAIKFINGIPQKFVSFVNEIGEETGISFEYGIDLKAITRSIDSDKLATKVIVKTNNNEFAKNGFCSIARSNQNYTRENFILNLDYYTQQNLLDKITLQKDLYSTQSDYIGYYFYLHKYNKEYDSLSDELIIKKSDLIKQSAQKEVYEQYLLAARQQLEVIESDMINLAGVSQWADAQNYARAHISNEKVQSLLNAHGEVQNEINKYQDYLNNITNTVNILQNYINDIVNRQNELINLLAEKHKEFNDKYSIYLMEGTWQDEDYISDDEYYLDGLNVAYTSSRPQLSYNINVLRLSAIEDFSSKIFNLGDICYMQDREFFGYLADGITPYKERILVSKISSYFDEPQKDILTIQNYKTRFDDLFQRITATTQSLSYAEGSFTRAAGAINPDGTLSFAALQDTFDYNEDLVINSSNQDVTWDDTGITITNKFNSADKTKIIAGGIFVTNDGGETWKNAVRGDGISTNLLTAGRVNTSEIYIYDGSAPSFRWDSDGITAYSYSGNNINFGKFVRHDKYGIYGYDGTTDFIPVSETQIWDNAKFGLTWSGFFLKSNNGSTSFEISTNNDLIIKSGNVNRVQIGRLNGSPTNYGFQLRDSNNNVVFTVDNNGANIAGWTMNNNSIFKTVGNNTIGLYSSGINATILGHRDNYYILAGNSFGVTVDGKIYAKSGKIGNWDITDTTLESYADNKHYLRLRCDSAGAFIEGMDGDKNYWFAGKNGRFSFVDSNMDTADSSSIVLGPTTINNKYIYTKNISAGGGSIGGVGISSSGLNFPSAGYIKIGDKTCTLASTPLVAWVNAWLTSNSSSRKVTSTGTMTFNFSSGSSNVHVINNQLYGQCTVNMSVVGYVSVPTYTLNGYYAYAQTSILRTDASGIKQENFSGAPLPV